MLELGTPDKYNEMSQHYIRQAEEEFQKGDFTQASEKAWGAAALAVKSVAARRGWSHHRHDLLYAVSDQIADEMERPELARLFRSISTLHTNFYEDWIAVTVVRDGIEEVKLYLQELEAIQAAPTPTFVTQTPEQAARLRKLTGS